MYNNNSSQNIPSSVSGARKGPKDDQPVLPSINTSFLPPAGLVGLPEVPSPRGGASYYRNSNPEATPAKSFNYYHELETRSYRGCNDYMDNINDDPKPFVPPISPEILQTSTKDEQERLIKWEISSEVNLHGSETYRTDQEKQPTLANVPHAIRHSDRKNKLRKSVSFDIPKEPSAPPLSPEPVSELTIKGKPPISPRRISNQPASSIKESGYSGNTNMENDNNTDYSTGSPTDEFNFGRMRFRQVGVSLDSINSNNNGDERVPTPPSAPKPANQNVAMDDRNLGKVRRQWQRESNELVIVTQSEPVSPRPEAATVQATSGQGFQQYTTSETALQPAHQNAVMQEQAKQQLMRQELIRERMHQELVDEETNHQLSKSEPKGIAPEMSGGGPVSSLLVPEAVSSNHKNQTNSDSTQHSKYLQDLHDIFDSCDQIEAKLSTIPSDNGNQEDSTDLYSIKETASKIVGNVIARAISEEEKRKIADDVYEDSEVSTEEQKANGSEPCNLLNLNDERDRAEFLERQETPTTVPDTDEDAAAKAEILNFEISNGINRFISSTTGVDHQATRTNSQASSQPAEVPPEELSEASQDDLEERFKLLRQDSFVQDSSTTNDPSARELEQKLKDLRNDFTGALSNSKGEVQREAMLPTDNRAVSVYQELYPSEELRKFYEQRESAETKPRELKRSDSGITSGSQAQAHIEDTIRLRELRAQQKQPDEEEMSITEQMNMVAYSSLSEGRNSANSMAGSDASSVKSGPISQSLPAENQHIDSDWSCRR